MLAFTYTDYDQIGAMFVKCMVCGQIVRERTYAEIDIRSAPPRKEKVLVFPKLGNYRQIRTAMLDGRSAISRRCFRSSSPQMSNTSLTRRKAI